MPRLLDRIDSPQDLKGLSLAELDELAGEIRHEIINTVTTTGGHLASNLGVVELSIALHRVFNSPEDKIVWDVGHQSYVHKLLTGRRQDFGSLRQYGGISGFSHVMGQIEVSFHNKEEASRILELVRYANVQSRKPLVEEELLFIATYPEITRKLLTLRPLE